MFRLLEEGELQQEGDEFYNGNTVPHQWVKIKGYLVGKPLECGVWPHRRKINTKEEKLKSPNTTKAEIKPCENDNCVNYSEDYDYNCCYFMDCKERV